MRVEFDGVSNPFEIALFRWLLSHEDHLERGPINVCFDEGRSGEDLAKLCLELKQGDSPGERAWSAKRRSIQAIRSRNLSAIQRWARSRWRAWSGKRGLNSLLPEEDCNRCLRFSHLSIDFRQ